MIDRLRVRRWLAGCYYFGCFAPVAFALLAGYILVDGLTRGVRRLFRRKP